MRFRRRLNWTRGDRTVLEVSFSADREDASEEAVLSAAEKLSLEWASSDESVVTVDGEGNITAVRSGEATVTVKSGELLGSCKVTVRPSLEALDTASEVMLYINGANAENGIIDSKTLDVKPFPENAGIGELTFESADETIAAVDETGKITAVSNGQTVVTIRSGSITAYAEVTVYTVPAFIKVADAEVYVGRSAKLAVEVDGEGVTYSDLVVYTSSDINIAQVNGYGNVTGISAGTAVITASNGTGVTGTATVTVKPASAARPASVSGSSGDTTQPAQPTQSAESEPAPAPEAQYCGHCSAVFYSESEVLAHILAEHSASAPEPTPAPAPAPEPQYVSVWYCSCGHKTYSASEMCAHQKEAALSGDMTHSYGVGQELVSG